MVVARRAGYLLPAYVCAFILAYLIPEEIDRPDFARAVGAYVRNPTQGSQVALEAQRRENDRIHLRDSAAAGLVLLGVGYGIWGGRRLMKRHASRSAPLNPPSSTSTA